MDLNLGVKLISGALEVFAFKVMLIMLYNILSTKSSLLNVYILSWNCHRTVNESAELKNNGLKLRESAGL